MTTFDLTSQAFSNNPYPVYQQMLKEAPIHWNEALGGWYICRYDDVVAGLRDPRLSNERFVRLIAQLPEELQHKLRHIVGIASKWTVSMDPPAHTRLRGLTNDAFTVRTVDGFRPRIEATLDRVMTPHRSAGRMDVPKDLSNVFPLAAIVELIGVPVAYIDMFRAWFAPMAEMFKKPFYSDEQIATLTDAFLRMAEYLHGILQERRRAPKNDILSHLTQVKKNGQSLSDDEIVQECILLLPAGHETTRLVMSHAVLMLLDHPDVLDALRREPALIPGAVEEILRLHPALHKVGRLALEDLDICGQRVAKGDLVWLGFATANRDPRWVSEPDRLDIHRKDNRHLAFGHGIHYCEGAGIARLELQIAIRHMIQLKNLKLAVPREQLTWVDGNHARELVSLPVTFDAAGAPPGPTAPQT